MHRESAELLHPTAPPATPGRGRGAGKYTDAAETTYRSHEVMLVLGAESPETALVLTQHQHPSGLAAGDLNGDGVDDLVVVGDQSRRAQLYLSVKD